MGKKTVGVVLAGCGHKDGSEIQEALLTLLALDRRGVTVRAFAPDVAQRDVVDHLLGQPGEGSRNVLHEAARLVRGKIAPLAKADAATLDAVILPGGFGAAKNLCTWASDGPAMTVRPELEALLRSAHAARKPLGFICIAPVIAAKLFPGVHLTLGDDEGTMAKVRSLGAQPVARTVEEIEVDADRRIVSTPAYMYDDTSIAHVAVGIDRLVEAVLKLA